MKTLTKDIKYIGVDDLDLDLFEGQYIVPEGMAYNSYLIVDEKICVMDTVDARKGDEWADNLAEALQARQPDYLAVLHMEPDHSANIVRFLEAYPSAILLCTDKAAKMLTQFFDYDFSGRVQVVKDGEKLSLGQHELQFVTAPMVHWPEVMMVYESCEQVLFAADAFGKFGALVNETDDWACEARRYYFNIVGKYGAQVQAVLKKVSASPIQMICPLHGPVLKENLSYYLNLYQTWSQYKPETEGVFIAFASIYGNTAKAAHYLADCLREAGVKVAISDLARDDQAEALEDAFRYDRMVLLAASYDGGLFPPMEEFLMHLKAKTYRQRRVALVENGSWAPSAGRVMKEYLTAMKEIDLYEPLISIRSAMKDADKDALKALALAFSKPDVSKLNKD